MGVPSNVVADVNETPDTSARHNDGFVLDVRSLGRRPGSMQQVHRTITTPHRLGVAMMAIPAESDVDLDVRLEAVSEGVLVTGTVSGDTTGQCSRCLDSIEGTVNVFMTELFAYPESETEATTDEDEVYRLDDDRVDLEQPIIDLIGLELPMTPLCADDCPGLCPDCGIHLAAAEAGHHHDKIDPRWAALQDKFGDGEDPKS